MDGSGGKGNRRDQRQHGNGSAKNNHEWEAPPRAMRLSALPNAAHIAHMAPTKISA
jgi:hypothetical protein